MLVGLPGGAIAFCLIWIGALGPLYYPNSRCFFGMFMASMPLLGSLLLLLLPDDLPWGIVVGTWFAGCVSPPNGQAIALMGANVKGNTKRSVVSALYFIFYCIGSIVGPQLWQDPEAPRYRKGCISSIISWALVICCFFLFHWTGKRSNKKRGEEFGGLDADVIGHLGVSVDADHTEREDKLFRYTL